MLSVLSSQKITPPKESCNSLIFISSHFGNKTQCHTNESETAATLRRPTCTRLGPHGVQYASGLLQDVPRSFQAARCPSWCKMSLQDVPARCSQAARCSCKMSLQDVPHGARCPSWCKMSLGAFRLQKQISLFIYIICINNNFSIKQ